MQAITIILGMLLALIGGYELGKRAAYGKVGEIIKTMTTELQKEAARLKEAKGETKNEITEDR